jgi:biopolymer transport protein ExbD
MAKRRRTFRQRVEDSTYELNLAPMLDMMVALVPFLLLSIAFVRLVVVETKIPQPVAKALKQDRDKKDRDVNIRMEVSAKKGVMILVKEKGKKTKKYSVKLKEGSFDVDAVHSKLVSIKQQYPKVFRLEILPKDNVVYKDVVQLMDTARYTTNSDPQLFVVDDETKEKVPSKLIFPDVIFGNVVGS